MGGLSEEARFVDFQLIGAANSLYKRGSYDMSDLRLKLQRSLLSGLLVCGAPALAQTSLLSTETAARSADARNAYTLIEEGDTAYLEQDYRRAVSKYAQALSKLPEGAKAVSGLRASAVQRFSQASLVQAQVLLRKGDAKGANALLDDVDVVDPDNAKAKAFREKSDDPIRTSAALTPAHAADVDRVRRLLFQAESFYDLGQFDRAYMTYEDILRIDKFNKAARRGMGRVNSAKTGYAEAARDQARAEIFKDVSAGWEQKVPDVNGAPKVGGDAMGAIAGGSDIQAKLNAIMIPEVRLSAATLGEAVDFLRAISIQGDTTTLDDSKKGVAFVVQLGDESMPVVEKIRASRIDLSLRNVPLGEALRLITEASSTTFRVDDFAVVLNASGFDDPTMIRREFRVPPDFLTSDAVAKPQADANPFGEGAGEGGLIAKTLTARERLQTFDVSFPEGATANYNANTNILVVRNTTANIRLIEAIVDEVAKTEPVVVTVRTTIVDISQKNLEELGFDVKLGKFNLGSNYFLSGGTTGTGTPISDMIGGSPVTSGNRSGQLSSDTDGLDALLARKSPPSASGTSSSDGLGTNVSSINLPAPPDTSGSRASGIISLRGIIDNTAHEILMRGLSQKKGTDVMVRPEVVTRPGQNASIQSVIEFPYPDEFEPPQLPNAVGGTSAIVTPATPTNFKYKNLGVSLEVLPQVGPDRRVIEVAVNPILTDFEGFVNYGTPIVGSSGTTTIDFTTGAIGGNSAFGEITANAILKPLFRVTEGKTAVRILDGQTIVMGGLVQEIRKEIHDKVPFLGDLPLIGRVFQENGMSVEKRAVIFFVNVELTDPAGNPYRDR
ncbi:MAG: general secretion pathway protein D [Akkermansiaceae bacterium]